MPASNEEFIKRAFEAGLTEDQVRSAVAERNTRMASKAPQPAEKPGLVATLKKGLIDTASQAFLPSQIQAAKFAADPVASRVLNLPSNLLGGALRAERESVEGTFVPPKIGPDFQFGKSKMNVGQFIEPSFVGSVRGVTANQTLMEEVPKTVGLDPKSLPGLAVGFGAEVLTPDPFMDAGSAGKAADALKATPAVEVAKQAISKAFKDDIIAELKPTKTILKEARERGIDLVDEIMTEGYQGDPLTLAKKADEMVSVLGDNIRQGLLADRRFKVDPKPLIDDIVESMAKKAQTDAEEAGIRSWGARRKRLLGDAKVTLETILDEKILAGNNGYKDNSDVVANAIGQAAAAYERKLRDILIKKHPELEGVLRKQEASMFLKAVFENATDSYKPYTFAQKVGRAANFPSLVRDTAGKAVETTLRTARDIAGPAYNAVKPALPALGRLAGTAARITSNVVSQNPQQQAIKRSLDKEQEEQQKRKLLPSSR